MNVHIVLLVTVMDDYSRFILAWELKSEMTVGSLIDVVQKVVDLTGMTDVPVEDPEQCYPRTMGLVIFPGSLVSTCGWWV